MSRDATDGARRRSHEQRAERAIPPLDGATLERLALAYVGRYATTQAKLRAYLQRKLVTRGWGGEGAPPIDALIEKSVALGYIDDRLFASSRAASLGRRGYGARRVDAALRAAGIAEDDAAPARAEAGDAAWATAVAFARRRRIGAFAAIEADPDRRRKALAAMLRAGHSFDMARRLVDMKPGEEPDPPEPDRIGRDGA